MNTKHSVKQKTINPNWLTTFNLWPYDTEHVHTCYCLVTLTKPTDRQVRSFKKVARKHIRHHRDARNVSNGCPSHE